jgi:CBS domain-containing protein
VSEKEHDEMTDEQSPDPTNFEDPLSDYEPPQYASELERALAEETVAEIQLKPYLQLSPDTPVTEAVKRLHESKVASALVVDDSGNLVGLFTERDVLERVAESYDRNTTHPVSEVMTTEPSVVYESDPAATAIAAIAVEGHRHVPVLDMNGKVLGLASPRRVFEFMVKHDR